MLLSLTKGDRWGVMLHWIPGANVHLKAILSDRSENKKSVRRFFYMGVKALMHMVCLRVCVCLDHPHTFVCVCFVYICVWPVFMNNFAPYFIRMSVSALQSERALASQSGELTQAEPCLKYWAEPVLQCLPIRMHSRQPSPGIQIIIHKRILKKRVEMRKRRAVNEMGDDWLLTNRSWHSNCDATCRFVLIR